MRDSVRLSWNERQNLSVLVITCSRRRRISDLLTSRWWQIKLCLGDSGQGSSDSLGYRVLVATVRNGSSGRYLEGRSAKSRCVGSGYETYLDGCWSPAGTGISINVENVDPVAWAGGVIV